MQRIEIDHDKCIACGMCQSTCPEVFEVQVKSTVVEKYCGDKENEGEVPDDVGCVSEAEKNCPVGAISVKE